MKGFILFSLLILGSCGDDNFPEVERLSEFRILAVVASSPEVAPGGNSNLSLYVSDVDGPTGGRVINGTTVSCIDPGISLGAPVSCDHDPNRVAGTYTVDTTAADLLNNLYTGQSGSISVTVPASILLGRSSREKTNGVGYIVIFNFTVDGREVSAFKRIIATDRGSLNSNPSGTTVLLNGAAFAGTPGEGDRLSATTSAPETYAYVNVDGSTVTRAEEIDVAWYISGAEFDRPKSDIGQAVKLTEAPPADSFVIVTVVRDDRGGVQVVRNKVP